MRTRTSGRLAWPLLGLLVVLLVTSNAFNAANGSLARGTALFTVDLLVVGFVGSLIAARRPGNRIGWLLIGVMLLMG